MSDTPSTDHGKTYAPFEAAYYGYLRELQVIGNELMQGVINAQKDCTPLPGDDMRAVCDKIIGYNDAIHSAWEDSQRRYKTAYFGFLDNFGRAWADADKTHISPPAMAMITQSAAAVASHASATIGNMDVFAWTGVPIPTAGDTRTQPQSENGGRSGIV